MSRRTPLALLAALSLALAAGCSSSKTFVLQPVREGVIHGHIALSKLEPTTNVDADTYATFETSLTKQLKSQVGAPIGQPTDLTLEYRFVLFDQGSTAARLGSGLAGLAGSPVYGVGDGAIGVEVVYKRPDGTTIGHIVTDGPISGAFGSTSGALDSAAAAVAKYTKANFTCPACGHVGPVNPEPARVDGLKQMDHESP